MKSFIKTNFVRFLCIFISVLLFLCSCNNKKIKEKKSNENSPLNSEYQNQVGSENEEKESNEGTSSNSDSQNQVTSENEENNYGVSDNMDYISNSTETENNNVVSDKKTDASSASSSSQKQQNTKEKTIKPTKSDEGSLMFGKSVLNGASKQIKSFKMLTKKPTSFSMVEMEMDVPALPSDVNVYDEKDIDITGEFVSSTGKTITADAFYYKEYDFLASGQLKGDSGKDAKFRIRISPKEEGTWDFKVTYKLKNKTLDSVSGYFNVKKNKNGSGLIMVEPNRKQNFITASGTPYIAIGENIAWGVPSNASTLASKYVCEQMKNCAKYGGNYARIWLNCWGGLAIENKNMGLMNFKQDASAQWDRIFNTAEKLGTKISFCFYTHGQFLTSGADAYFNNTPWSTILNKPIEFFTNEDAVYASRQEIRYLVSRYGYSESILCWELFNEVDLVSDAKSNTDAIRKWSSDTAGYLRKIDPYRHLVSSSTSIYTSPLAILSCFDFINFHRYNYGPLSSLSDLIKETWVSHMRPVLISECGSVGDEVTLIGSYIPEDLSNFHRQNWVGLMGGGAGSCMSWWWESVDERDAFWDFQILSEMAAHIPWSEKRLYMYRTESANLNNSQIEALGYRGDEFAYLWFYDKMFTHLHRVTTDFDKVTAEVNLKDGTYHIRWINTWTGVSVKKEVLSTKDGILKFTMPKWSKDIAVAITKD